jgi:hypothetical protein
MAEILRVMELTRIIDDCQLSNYSTSNFAAMANRQSSIGNGLIHPLPRDGTDSG